MENSFRDEKNIFNLQVDEVSKSHLLQLAKWAKFIAIVMFIFLGLMVLAGIIGGAALASVSGMGGMGAMGGTAIALVYILIAAIYFYPLYALIKYSGLVKPAIQTSNQQQFNEALGFLKGSFKYMGIMMIIFLALYALVLIFVMIGAAM